MEHQPACDKPKATRRKWWQYTLRSLLVFMLLISFPLAWIGNEIASRKSDEKLADAIEKAGGRALRYQVNRFSLPHDSDDPNDGQTWTKARRITDVLLSAGTPGEFQALLSRVRHLEYLDTLILSDTCLSDADLSGIERLSKLNWLDLTATSVGDEGIDVPLRLPNLQHLSLDLTDISDAGLEKLARHPSLDSLNVSGTQVTPQGVAKFQRERPDVLVTWQGLAASQEEVRAARKLSQMGWKIDFVDDDQNGCIRLDFTRDRRKELTEAELACLKCLPRFVFWIWEGAPRNLYAALPELDGLEELALYCDTPTLNRLVKCRKLKDLCLRGDTPRQDDLAILQEFPHLESLMLDAETLTEEGIRHIAKVKQLTKLRLARGHFSDQSLASLTALKGLKHLGLWEAKFEPGATRPLGGMKSLKYLDLEESNLDDINLAPLLALPALEELKLKQTKISDRGLLRVAEIKPLKRLQLSVMDNVTDAGREQFSKLRPDVKLE